MLVLVFTSFRSARSLSARRAWIEMLKTGLMLVVSLVALRKESVDRNSIALGSFRACTMVALRKESVDRNHNSIRRCLMSVGRSPQGERG